MSGYTPVFDTVFQGTLCGKWPTLPIWLTILPLADKNGRIDMTPEAIGLLTGWPLEILIKGLTELCQPDPRSRSKAEGGARLKLIDQDRDWGWQVVNHGQYREKARLMAKDSARTASGQDAERKRASRDVPRSPPISPSHTQTHTQTYKDQRALKTLSSEKPQESAAERTQAKDAVARIRERIGK